MTDQDVPLIHDDKQQRRRQIRPVRPLRQLQPRQKFQQCAAAGIHDRPLLCGLVQRQEVLQRMFLKIGAQPAAVFHRRLLRIGCGAGSVREREDLIPVFRPPVEDHILAGHGILLVMDAAPQVSHNIHRFAFSFPPARPAVRP